MTDCFSGGGTEEVVSTIDSGVGSGNVDSVEIELFGSGVSAGVDFDPVTSVGGTTSGAVIVGETITVCAFVLELFARERLFFSTGTGTAGSVAPEAMLV